VSAHGIPLRGAERARLRGLAHGLRPVVQIGREGITVASLTALQEAFNTRELLKVRVLSSAPHDVRNTAQTLVSKIDGATLVQTVGHIAVLFRPRPEEHGG
jgi:RNA-binding protein